MHVVTKCLSMQLCIEHRVGTRAGGGAIYFVSQAMGDGSEKTRTALIQLKCNTACLYAPSPELIYEALPWHL